MAFLRRVFGKHKSPKSKPVSNGSPATETMSSDKQVEVEEIAQQTSALSLKEESLPFQVATFALS